MIDREAFARALDRLSEAKTSGRYGVVFWEKPPSPSDVRVAVREGRALLAENERLKGKVAALDREHKEVRAAAELLRVTMRAANERLREENEHLIVMSDEANAEIQRILEGIDK